jgi:hypothetical protein
MKKHVWTLAAAVALLLSAGQAEAQLRFGGQLSYGDAADLGVGARVEFGLENFFANLFGIASVDYFFYGCGSGTDCSWIEINPGAAIPIPLEGQAFAPYAGAGLGIRRWEVGSVSDTAIGLNLLGGLKFPAEGRRWTPFAEARVGIGTYGQFVISGGVLF